MSILSSTVRATAAVALTVALGLTGYAHTPKGDTARESTPTPQHAAIPAADPLREVLPSPPAGVSTKRKGGPPVAPGIPTGIEIPELGVHADIVVTEVVNGAFVVPDDIQTVGWDKGTVKPGARRGTALMAGHLDDRYGNEGALHDLLDLEPGDTLTVETRTGSLAYRVAAVRNYRKDGLPVEIVARDGEHRIALVTCGGPLVRGNDGLMHYRDNIVVWAGLAG